MVLLVCGLLIASLSLSTPPQSSASDADIQRMLDESSAAFAANDPTRGRTLAESARTLAVEHERPVLEAEALFRLGKDDAWFRRFDEAVGKLERARALFAQHGNRQREAMAISEVAWTLVEKRGDLPHAVELLESARKTFRELGDATNDAIAGDRRFTRHRKARSATRCARKCSPKCARRGDEASSAACCIAGRTNCSQPAATPRPTSTASKR